MKFIDMHVHIYPKAIAGKAAQSIRNYYKFGPEIYSNEVVMDGTASMLMERGRQAGLTKYLVLPVAVKPEHVQSINDYALSQMEQNDCFLAFGTVYAGMENMMEEVDRIRTMGLRGIKIHPDCQKFDIDDPRLFPMYEHIQGKLPMMIHMGDQDFTYSHPSRLRHVLDLFPKLQVCAAHFGGYTMYEDACRLLHDKDCIMDISSSLMFMDRGMPERYINIYGAERLAFGTDYPVWDPVHEVQRMMELDITMEQKEQIAHKTAERFLGL